MANKEIVEGTRPNGYIAIGRTSCCRLIVFQADLEPSDQDGKDGKDGEHLLPCVTKDSAGMLNCQEVGSAECRRIAELNSATTHSCWKCSVQIFQSDIGEEPVRAVTTMRGFMSGRRMDTWILHGYLVFQYSGYCIQQKASIRYSDTVCGYLHLCANSSA